MLSSPKTNALQNGILKRTVEMKAQFKKKLFKSNFAIHMSLNMCTAPYHFFLSIIIHFVNQDWIFHKMLLAFTHMIDHDGAGLVEIVHNT